MPVDACLKQLRRNWAPLANLVSVPVRLAADHDLRLVLCCFCRRFYFVLKFACWV